MDQITDIYNAIDVHVQKHSIDLMEWAQPGSSKYTLTKDWPLANPMHALCVAVGYLVFVFVASAIMKCKKTPVDVSTLKYLYNPVQVGLCAFMMIEAVRQALATGENKVVGMTFNPNRRGIAEILWWFYLSKVLDFLDTVFIILGQKWKQLSFLHVYHHTSIFIVYWMDLRSGFDGDIYLTIVLNCFVHFVMYTYYMITSLNLYDKKVSKTGGGVDYVKYSPSWKSLVTLVQLVQFVIMNVQATLILYNNYQFPRNITWGYLIYIQSLFWLFVNFFVKSYCGGKKDKKNKKKNQ